MCLFRVIDQRRTQIPVEILIADFETFLLSDGRIVGVEFERSHAGSRYGSVRSHVVGFVAQFEQRVVGVFGIVCRSASNQADLVFLASGDLDLEGAGEVSGADQAVEFVLAAEFHQFDRLVAELGFVGVIHLFDVLGENFADAVELDVVVVLLTLLFEQRVIDEGALSVFGIVAAGRYGELRRIERLSVVRLEIERPALSARIEDGHERHAVGALYVGVVAGLEHGQHRDRREEK